MTSTSPLSTFTSALDSALPELSPTPPATRLAEATFRFINAHDPDTAPFRPTDQGLARVAKAETDLKDSLMVIRKGEGWRQVMRQAGDEYACLQKKVKYDPVTDLMRAHSLQFKIAERQRYKEPFLVNHCAHLDIDWDSELKDFCKPSKTPGCGAAKGVKKDESDDKENENPVMHGAEGASVIDGGLSGQVDNAVKDKTQVNAKTLTTVIAVGTDEFDTIKLHDSTVPESGTNLVACVIPCIQVILIYCMSENVVVHIQRKLTRNRPLEPKPMLAIPFKDLIDPGGVSEGMVKIEISLGTERTIPMIIAGCKTCIICLDKPRAQMFRTCRHYVTCEDCAGKMPKCPMCNGRMHSMDKIYPVILTGGDQSSHRR